MNLSAPIPFDVQWIIQGKEILHDGFFNEFLGLSQIFSQFFPSFRLTKSHFFHDFNELPISLNSTAYLSLDSRQQIQILDLISFQHKFSNLSSLPTFQQSPSDRDRDRESDICLNLDSDLNRDSVFLFDDLAKPIVPNIDTPQECCQACLQEPLCIGWEFDCSESYLPECRLKGQVLKVRPFYFPNIETKASCRQGSFPASSRLPLPRFKIFHGISCSHYNFFIRMLKKDMNTIYIGRYMFEKGADGIQLGLTGEEHQVFDCAHFMDEIWVPSEWNKQVFLEIANLFRMKLPPIVVIPEATNIGDDPDSPLSSPHNTSEKESQTCQSSSLSPPLSSPSFSNSKPFQFLSIFKWEDRKGWATLLRAYWTIFKKDDPVVLRLHSYRPHFLSGEKNITENLINYAMEFFGQELGELASIHLGNAEEDPSEDSPIHHQSNRVAFLQGSSPILSRQEIKRLYLSSDAFVLPTRGEGWGLPIAEAMQIGLPVIVTNYSGVTEYANEANSFLIPVEMNEQTGRPRVLSDGFVVPSVKALSELMLVVYQNATLRAQKASLAKVTMTQKFHSEEIVSAMAERMKDLARLRGWIS